MLISLFFLFHFGHAAFASTNTVDMITLQVPQFLSTMSGAVSPCSKGDQYVSAIRIHPKGAPVQVYTLQVLDSGNTWQSLNVSGIFPRDKDSDWIPLTVGLNRCISQVMVYGAIVPTPKNDSTVKLLISAQLSSIK